MRPILVFKHEALAILKLAWPLILAQLAGVGMGATDIMMAGRLGKSELAAAALGSNLSMIGFVFCLGLFMATSAVVARWRGESVAAARIGSYTRSMCVLAVCAAALWWALTQALAYPVLSQLDLAPRTLQLAVDYLRVYAGSALGMCLWFALRFVAEGLGRTAVVMVSGLVGLLANAWFNYVFIWGFGPFKGLGLIGSAWATTAAAGVMALTLLLMFAVDPVLRTVRSRLPTATMRADVPLTLRLGVPIGLILVAEAGLFVVVAALMGRIGEDTVAAYQVAINIAALLFMIPLSVGLATTVRVGFFVGSGQNTQARVAGQVGMLLGMTNAATNAAIMIVFGPILVSLYSSNAEVVRLAIGFLILAAAFQFFDGLQVTANGALRGLKDTTIPMVITLVAYWLVGLPVAVHLGFYSPLGADGLWWGLTVGLGLAAAGLSWRFTILAK